ncbi:MAG: acylphosphatase [Alphaproteobacteria bacterium]|nr:acylphosphatase [Alphaproteobacteria bacterium]
MTDTTTKHLRIFGHVQGVYYRAWTQETANGLNLTGWVRNRKDGSVEAIVSGPESQIMKFIKACHEGPELATVDTISINEGINEGFTDFTIRETA